MGASILVVEKCGKEAGQMVVRQEDLWGAGEGGREPMV